MVEKSAPLKTMSSAPLMAGRERGTLLQGLACSACTRPLKRQKRSVEARRKTTLCKPCWQGGAYRRLPPHLCGCGAAILRRSKRCADCYRKEIAVRNRLQASSLAEKRAAKSWRFRRSKAERRAMELFDVLGVAVKAQVPFGTLVVDFVMQERLLAIEVFGDYWHG